MRDVCDGNFLKNHPVFKAHPDALQFILYHDEYAILLGQVLVFINLVSITYNCSYMQMLMVLLCT